MNQMRTVQRNQRIKCETLQTFRLLCPKTSNFCLSGQELLKAAALDSQPIADNKEAPLDMKLHSFGHVEFPMPKAQPDKRKSEDQDQEFRGLWIDANVMARIHGSGSKLSAPQITSEEERLLHYADISLGTGKRDRFKSEKPSKSRSGTRNNRSRF